MGAAARHSAEEGAIERPRLVGAESDLHGDAGRAEPAEPPAVDERVRVTACHDHARDAGRHERVGAWRSPAVVSARLEGDVERRAAGGGPRFGEGDRLRMWPARSAMRPLAHDDSRLHEDGADQRVRRRQAEAGRREPESAIHPLLIGAEPVESDHVMLRRGRPRRRRDRTPPGPPDAPPWRPA